MAKRRTNPRRSPNSRSRGGMNQGYGGYGGDDFGLGSMGNSRGGIVRWLTRRINQSIRRMFNKMTGNRGNVDKSKVKVDEESKPNYIKEVDSFAKQEQPIVQPIYNYGKTDEDVELLGDEDSVDGLGKVNDTSPGEPKDLWDTADVTESDKEYYGQRLAEMSKEVPANRKEILSHYRGMSQNAQKEQVSERVALQDLISKNLTLDSIEHVPYFLNHGAEIEANMKQIIPSTLTDEVKDAYIMEELKRYRDVMKDFMTITEKEGKYYIADWELGVKAIDFMVKEGQFPEIILLLTPSPMEDVVNVMRTGYLPDYLRNTPFDKVLRVFESIAKGMAKEGASQNYSFPKAYVSYKQQLPMYKKLRNNGNLANVNTVLEYFYNAIDKVEVNADVQGDAYLGLIEPETFINAYIQFFYGKAKQTQAMSDVTVKIMKKDPTILKEAMEKGYAVGDKPEGTLFIVAGHLVLLVNVADGKYSLAVDKAPSDITSEDITAITGMFSAERKKAKLEKPKPKTKTTPAPAKQSKGLSYDYDKAIDSFKKEKAKKKANKGG